MTNFEKIKAMSIEEMAVFIFKHGAYSDCRDCVAHNLCDGDDTFCYEHIEEWLESETEENMLPEICSCGYRFENDETICPNCGKKAEE